MLYTKLFKIVNLPIVINKYSTKCAVELSKKVAESIESEEYKPRKNPGIFKPRTNAIPDNIVAAMKNVFEDFPIRSVYQDSKKLVTFLFHRHAPDEKQKIKQPNLQQIEQTIINELDNKIPKRNIQEKFHDDMTTNSKTNATNWKAVYYNTYIALQYLVGRSAAEYAVLVRIFTEMNARLSDNFKPRTFFDFGSGLGTGTWAANLFWGQTLYEYFCVDISPDMNDLADTLLKKAFANKTSFHKGVFYRQFLPASHTQYDIVLSAYSLLELPSANSRLETILNLWNKTYQFLVIVEQGNSTGFQIINEVREFILNIQNENTKAHVFMPCPHNKVCPRLLHDHTPCNFEVSYQTLPFVKGNQFGKERFSYVVFQKIRKNEKNINDKLQENWPRIVRPVLVRSKHTICRICDPDGTLKEIIFTASKHGKSLYYCARQSKWGDLLPITKVKSEDSQESNEDK